MHFSHSQPAMECVLSLWIWVRLINFLSMSNGQSCIMMKSWGLPGKKQCHPHNELASSVCFFKRHFSLQGAIVIQLWTVLWHVLKRRHQKGFVIGIPKNTVSLFKKKKTTHTQSPKIVCLDIIWHGNTMRFEWLESYMKIYVKELKGALQNK